MSRTALLSSSAILALLVAAPALASAPRGMPIQPAVSALNGKVEAFGGSLGGLNNTVSGWGVAGAFSAPLASNFGFQIDGLAGAAGGFTYGGVAGHAFWRNPQQGLLGLYASTIRWTGIGADVHKVGVEGELYLGRASFEGLLALQTGTFTGFAGKAVLAYYLNDNLRLDAGFRRLEGVGGVATAGVEFLHQPMGLSFFANGSWGGTDYHAVLGGVKFYTGPQKSLIRRQREDDPGIGLPFDLFQTCSVLTIPTLKIGDGDGICFVPGDVMTD